MDFKMLKDSLIERDFDKEKVNKFIAYVSGEVSKGNRQISSNSQNNLFNMFVKYYNAGTNIDGVNVVITGNNMALITANGFKNKVRDAHPDVSFDIQLVRDGDEYSFKKESGKVVYSHTIGSPFDDLEIKGAYCVVKFGNTEHLETLNQRDFEEMKASSRNQATWNKWPSEFWLKSVVKRACKRYFTDEVKQLEELDNSDYGLQEEKADNKTKNEILKSHGAKVS